MGPSASSGAPVLVAGASGFIGRPLVAALRGDRRSVRALSRNPAGSPRVNYEPVRGDLLTGEGLDDAMAGVELAYYLVHSMEAGKAPFWERERTAAENFGQAAAEAGVRRIVYLGGLGLTGREASPHLRSRHMVAEQLAGYVPELVYARAALVVGDGGGSFDLLVRLAERAPVIPRTRWTEKLTQPIALRDTVAALVACGDLPEGGGEVQLGGPDVVSYADMAIVVAQLLGHTAPPRLPTPGVPPQLAALAIGFAIPGAETGLLAPLLESVSHETVVERDPPAGINDAPMGFSDAAQWALADAGLTGRPVAGSPTP
ncbi:MAG: NAD(P)H-binding protein [Solirubrobacterales bacterium]